MCDLCRKYPCDARCPYADDPPAIFICSECGGDICIDEYYWDVLGEQYCEECIDSFRKIAEYIED